MELKLKFVGINENDVITTSCNIIATKSVKFLRQGYTYEFDGEIDGEHDYVNIVTNVYDTNGTRLGDESALDVGSYYHYDSTTNSLYLCDKTSHHYSGLY